MFSISRGAAVSAMIMVAAAGPALAEGKADRARAAIAEAKGKIDTVNTMGASGEVPRMVAEARSALREAEDDLKGGHKDEAIAAALHASKMADTAVGVAQKARAQDAAAQQADANAATVAAQDQAAAAQDQAASAQVQADTANARAASAEHTAAVATADAAAARAAPATTIVTTETTKKAATVPVRTASHHVVHKKVVKHPVHAATVTEKTTTTVETNR